MKKIIISLLLFASSLWAQSLPVAPFSGTITASGCITVPVGNRGNVVFQVTGGTWTGTIQPKAIIGSQTAQNIQVTPLNGSAAQSTITANGVYSTTVAGFDKFQLCGNTVTNTATVTGNASQYVAKNIGNGAPVVPVASLTDSTTANVAPVLATARTAAIINQQSSGSGDIVLYTVPSGKRATIGYILYNSSVGTINYVLKAKIGGTAYQLGASVAFNTNTVSQGAVIFNTYPILEAGDQFIITPDGAGMNIFGYVITFDTSESLKSGFVVSDGSSTSYTLFTCCDGDSTSAFIINQLGANGPIKIFNNSGSTRTYNLYVVPNGGSQTSATKAQPQFTLNNNTSTSIPSGTYGLAVGDSIQMTTDAGTAGQLLVLQNLVQR